MTIAVLEALTFGLGRMVAAAETAGQRLCLLTGNRDIYRHELAQLSPTALDVVDVDTHDLAACAAALKAVPDLRGLINSTDTWLLAGAELAAQFGLPGPDPAAVHTLRDKARVRVRLHERGLSRGTAVTVPPGPGAARSVRNAIGLPAVVKDSAGTGSRNVWLARDAEQLDAALAEAAGRTLFGRLVAEPFLAGPLYSAETLGWAGRTRLLGVTGRLISPQWFGREDLLSFPVLFPGAELAALEDWVVRVLAVAGHTQGFAHVEFVLTADGPELVEINGRIGGCLAGEALCRSLGTNVYDAMIDMALGGCPALLDEAGTGDTARPTATALVYPNRPGTFTGITGVEELPALPGAPEWYPTMLAGRRVEHLGDQRACTGLLLAEGATTELAIYHAHSAAATLRPAMA
ncbi:MAG: ATP-grasp domain-containing protein [Pseudonocardiaceae bacterium]